MQHACVPICRTARTVRSHVAVAAANMPACVMLPTRQQVRVSEAERPRVRSGAAGLF